MSISTLSVPPFAKLAVWVPTQDDKIVLIFEGEDGKLYSIKFPATIAGLVVTEICRQATEAEKNAPDRTGAMMQPLHVKEVGYGFGPGGEPMLTLIYQEGIATQLVISPENLGEIRTAIYEIEKKLVPSGGSLKH